MSENNETQAGYEETLGHSGHRLTPQRREVYDVLLSERDHPTATEVFIRAKQKMPTISLATVYNCLETLVDCGLAKQVNVEREATRYCPNLEEHGHFVCDRCSKVFDVTLAAGQSLDRTWKLPKGFTVLRSEVTLRGLCNDCNT
ncbi:MAG: transcriptional repressor [Terrimicrobiaceae bacterium]